jgi:hypothetical protein
MNLAKPVPICRGKEWGEQENGYLTGFSATLPYGYEGSSEEMGLCQTLLRLYPSFMAGDMCDYFIGFLDDVRSLFIMHRIFVKVSLLHKSVLYFVSLKCFAASDRRFYCLTFPIILYSVGFLAFILAEVTFHQRRVESFILNYFYYS